MTQDDPALRKDSPDAADLMAGLPLSLARHRIPRGDRECSILVIGCTGGWGNQQQSAQHMVLGTRKSSAHVSVGRKGRGVAHAQLDNATLHSPGAVDWDGRGQVNLRSASVLLCNRGGVRLRTAHDFAARAPYGWTRAAHPKTGRMRSWENFGEPQLRGLGEIVAQLSTLCPSLQFVAGREDLVADAADPGPIFPWAGIDWRRFGLTRLEHDWQRGGWFRWRGPKRRAHEPGR